MNRQAIIILVVVLGIVFGVTVLQSVSAAPADEQSGVIVSGVTTPAGEAYVMYHRAAMEGNLEGVKKVLIRETHKQFNNGIGEKFISFYQKSIPKNITIMEEDVNENSASLVVEGTSSLGKGQSTVTMRLEDDIWKVVKEKWKF